MTKKELFFFLMENTKISADEITTLDEIQMAYSNEYTTTKWINRDIGLFLSILYENQLKKCGKGYNIILDLK